MSGQLTEHQIKQKANAMRESIVKMLEHAGSGHSAGPLGLADLVATLYFGVMNIDPAEPDKSNRDLFFLSNGHCVPVQYVALRRALVRRTRFNISTHSATAGSTSSPAMASSMREISGNRRCLPANTNCRS